MSDHPVDLAMIQAAVARIKGKVRQTPILDPLPMRGPVLDAGRLLLKLECQQVTGSFKARGASNKLQTLDDKARGRGLVTASGGNHGLAVAYAAASAGVPFTTNHLGSMFGGFFTEESEVTQYHQVINSNVAAFNQFFHLMLDSGVYLAPASFEAGFMSSAHTDADIAATVDAARAAFTAL